MSQAGILSDSTSAAPDIETLSGDAGGIVGPDAAFNINVLGNPDIDVVGTPASNQLQLTNLTKLSPFVVDSVVGAAPYSTIQDALDAANAASGGMVFVRPGTYTENLTLYDETQIIGAVGLGDFGALVIDGVHTPPATGSFIFRNIRLESATHIFSSAVAGSAILTIIDANIVITNGYLFNLLNWTGTFVTFDLADQSTNNGMVNNTGGATCFFVAATHGAGSGNTMITSGPVVMQEVDLNCPWDSQTGSSIACDYTIFSQNVTCSNNSTGNFSSCRFTTGATQALTMSSSASMEIANSTIDSSNNPSIGGAGAGNLQLKGISYMDNAQIAPGVNTAFLHHDVLGNGSTVGAVTADLITYALRNVTAVYQFTVDVSGISATGDAIGGRLVGTIKTTGAASSIVNTVDQTINSDAALAVADVTVIAAGNNLVVRATGVAGETISWNAYLHLLLIN